MTGSSDDVMQLDLNGSDSVNHSQHLNGISGENYLDPVTGELKLNNATITSENDGCVDEDSNKLITNEVYNKVELSDVYGNVDDLGRINNDYENIFDNYGSHKMTQHGSLGSSSLESPAMQTTALMNMGTF